uniref:Integrase catalytic domain-containing protein n=1 Tax=Globodera rostochiensis TaxID=31243 RepID=A0A914I2G9_GLORO
MLCFYRDFIITAQPNFVARLWYYGSHRLLNAPEMRKVPLHPWEVPERPWQRLHIDFCGPFLNKMWLIVVDAKTKWPEVKSVLDPWIVGTNRSDNGPQFTVAEFGKFCAERSIIHTRTAPYHPQSNGEAERFVQTFKKGMSLIKKETNWENELAKNQFLINYRVTPHTGTGRAPAEMMFGRELRTKLDLVRPVVEPKKGGGVVVKCSQKYQDRSKRNFERGTWKRSFEVGQRVFARNYRDGPKWMGGQNTHLDQLKADKTASDHEGSEDSESNASDPEGKEAGREQELSPNRDLRADSPEHPPETAPPELRRTQRKQRTIFRPERMSQIGWGGDVVFEDGIHNAKDQ